MAGNGKLEAFWDIVLHPENGSRGGVGYSGNPTSDSVVVVPSVGLEVHMPAGTGIKRTTTS